MGLKALWILLLLLVAGMQYRIWFGEGSLSQALVLQQEIEKQKETNAGLRLRNEKLYAEVTELKEVRGAIEENARSQLGMVYPHEQFFWLIQPSQIITD